MQFCRGAAQVERPQGVDRERPHRVLPGLAHARQSRQVVNGIRGKRRQGRVQGVGIVDISGLRQPQDFVAALLQVGEEPGPDEPIAPRDECAHSTIIAEVGAGAARAPPVMRPTHQGISSR